MKGKFHNINIISCHAPTENTDEDEIEAFYDLLDKTCESTRQHDMLLICGDFNAKIGREQFVSNVAGRFSLHETTSDNGIKLCDFASTNKLWIKSVSFPHKKIHKGTWKIPGSHSYNQIDHVLVDKRHATSVEDVRAYRGANCDSDHHLVVAKVKQRIANVYKAKSQQNKRYNVQELTDDAEKRASYERKIASNEAGIKSVEESEDVNEMWLKLKELITSAAQQTIKPVKNKRNDDWFDLECRQAIATKNEARQKMIARKTRRATVEYNRRRIEANKICRRKKKVEEIEKDANNNKVRAFYKEVAYIRKGYQPKANMCKNAQGKIVNDEREIIATWKQHFEKLLNTEQNQDEINQEEECVYSSADPQVDDPSYEEVIDAIKSLKNNKAAGTDSINAELIKYGGETTHRLIYEIIKAIWRNKRMPYEWKIGILCPVYKKGDKLDCANYRGITLLCVAYKILTSIILNRIKSIAEEVIGEYQCGFRQGRSTTDQLFLLSQAAEKCIEHGIDIHCLFIDFKQAFDSVNRKHIKNALLMQGIPRKIVNLILMTLENTAAKVAVENSYSEHFEINTGVRQGDYLSAMIFNLVINYALMKIEEINHNSTIINRTTQLCGYADDLALIARNTTYLKNLFKKLESEIQKLGLKINYEKTKYMLISATKITPSTLNIDNHEIEGVSNFKYLGVVFNEKNIAINTIQDRIQAGNRAYHALKRLMTSKNISQKTKLKMYKTLIRPVVSYGCETWRLTEANKIMVFERRILRKIFGPIQENGVYRIRYNHELERLAEHDTINKFIRKQRLHVVRMPETRVQHNIFENEVRSNRRRGRPRKRWKDSVQRDLQEMNIRNWEVTNFYLLLI